MRIGFIGDIHGDVAALEWALDALAQADRIVSLGDVVDGRDDRACVRVLRERGVTVVQGNHDHWATREGVAGRAPVDDLRGWLAALPRTLEDHDWLACHSRFDVTESDAHWEYLAGEVAVRRAFHQFSQRVVFCGHTHVPAINVLTGDQVEYIGTAALREMPLRVLEPGKRYVVNAGRPTDCVVTYAYSNDEPADDHVVFTFRAAATSSPPAEPPAHPLLRWWRRR